MQTPSFISGFLWTCSEQAVVRQPGSDTVDGLEVEDESRRTRSGNADHHLIARLASLLVEHRVAVVRDALEDGRLAGSARPLRAGAKYGDSGFLHTVQDRLVHGPVSVMSLLARTRSGLGR